MGRRWRVFQPQVTDPPGDLFDLERDDAHHVRRVLRLTPGETVSVFDGHGNEWEATLVECGPERVRARLGHRLEDVVEPPVAVDLFPALCRPDKMDWVVQKATELGVSAIRPWVAERVESDRVPDRRLARWRRIAVESCKQSGRRRVPEIELAAGLPAVEGVAAWILDPAAERSLAEVAAEPAGRLWLAVGPEGGLAPDELERAAAAGWRQVRLGPRVLRTETANIVAVALALHLWGDLGSAR